MQEREELNCDAEFPRWPLDESRVFVLGAGFSACAGFPLVRDLKARVLSLIEASDHPGLQALRDVKGREIRWALQGVDPDGSAPFEVVLRRLEVACNARPRDPGYGEALEALHVGTTQLLWTLHRRLELPAPYHRFGTWLRETRGGPIPAVISFNWDLVVEQALRDARIPFGYLPDMSLGTPVIKPHGSINWVGFERQGMHSNYRGWLRFANGLAVDRDEPFGDPDPHDLSDVRYVLFPGQKELPEGDEDQAWLWQAAAEVIDSRHTLVFIGYSMPEYDAHAIRFFMEKARDKRVEVFNPSREVLDHFAKIFVGHDLHLEALRFEDSPYAATDPIEIERSLRASPRSPGFSAGWVDPSGEA